MGVIDKVCMFHPASQKGKRTIYAGSHRPVNWTGAQEYDYIMEKWKINWDTWRTKGFKQSPNVIVRGSEPPDLGTGVASGYPVPRRCPQPWNLQEAAAEFAPEGTLHTSGWTIGDVITIVLPATILTCMLWLARRRGAGGRAPGRFSVARVFSPRKSATTPRRECKVSSPNHITLRIAAEEEYLL